MLDEGVANNAMKAIASRKPVRRGNKSIILVDLSSAQSQHPADPFWKGYRAAHYNFVTILRAPLFLTIAAITDAEADEFDEDD
jgi:hypothetical protein